MKRVYRLKGASINPSRQGFKNTRSFVLQVCALLGIGVGLLKAAHLQLWTPDSLQDHGAVRYERDLVVTAQRGKILDRKGNELANNITTSAVSLVGSQAKLTDAQKNQVVQLLGMKRADFDAKQIQAKKGFIYLKRQLDLEQGRSLQEQLRRLKIPGVYVTEEYRRYYPAGEAAAQLLGFTNLSGQAVEGLEIKLNDKLLGVEGSRRVMRTGVGSVVDDLEIPDPAQNGQDVQLTIDNDLQYVVYSELRNAVTKHNAEGGSAVMLDAKTGEILALANYPSFDPNKAGGKTGENMRNRAVTDAFEPGSTVKPFTMALALEKKTTSPRAIFSGEPFMVKNLRVNDGEHSHAQMTLSEVMQYSSNVGMVKMSLKLSAEDMHSWFSAVGLGKANKLPIGGATTGTLRPPDRWRAEDKATAAYGYGLSASLLQLARSYTVFTNKGDLLPLSLVKSTTRPQGVSVMKPATADLLKHYMEAVTGPKGTAPLAQVANYTTAGKTGTAKKQSKGHYLDGQYVASFVGFAPASNPKVIVAVMIDTPKGQAYYGGQVAAPVFANMVSATMRVLNITPDAPNHPVVNVPPINQEQPL